ncbi:MAG: Gfo/Idh/MocA family protein [Niabella sp.]
MNKNRNWQRRDFIKASALTSLSVAVLGKISNAKKYISPLKRDKVLAGKRVGIIGLDTSHAIAFTNAMNNSNAGIKYKGYKVVAAYPYGSREIESSYKRIPGYTEQVKAKGVEIVDSISDLLKKVDVVLLETNDGRLHREQAFQVIDSGKTMFIDKPMANSAKDVIAIFNYAKQKNVPVFSSSSLRFSKGLRDVSAGKVGTVIGADTFSPSPFEKTHTDFFWYGIHGIEMLFTLMGPGCESVTRFYEDNMDVVVGVWKGGRIGTFRGLRTEKTGYGGHVYGTKGVTSLDSGYSNDDILLRVIDFFETGISPVNPQETIEIAAFIDAAQKSKNKKGHRISLAPYLNLK